MGPLVIKITCFSLDVTSIVPHTWRIFGTYSGVILVELLLPCSAYVNTTSTKNTSTKII